MRIQVIERKYDCINLAPQMSRLHTDLLRLEPSEPTSASAEHHSRNGPIRV
jgi:hypothetical protein